MKKQWYSILLALVLALALSCAAFASEWPEGADSPDAQPEAETKLVEEVRTEEEVQPEPEIQPEAGPTAEPEAFAAFADPRAAGSIALGATVSGSITTAGGENSYAFTLTVSGKVAVDFTSYMRYYTLDIYTENGERPWTSGGQTYDSTTKMRRDQYDVHLEAGTYSLRVRSVGQYGTTSTGDYTFKTAFTPSNANETEPNDSVSTANAIAIGETVRGQIALRTTEDMDYYRFSLSTSGRLAADITSYMHYYTLEIYAENGERPWTSGGQTYDSATQMRRDQYTADLDAGTYVLRVRGVSQYGSPSTGNYNFKTAFTTAGATETEFNDSVETASSLPEGNVIRGQIALRGGDGKDVDYYRIPLPVERQVTLDVTSYMRYYTLELYAEDGRQVWTSGGKEYDYSTLIRQDHYTVDLKAGTYFLRMRSINQYNSTATGNYTIRLGGLAGVPAAGEYRVDGISIRSSDGALLSAIPKDRFLVSVSVTRFVSERDPLVLLAAYSAGGEYRSLIFVKVTGLQDGAAFEVTLPVDNTSGGIAQLKAFAVESFQNPQPLGGAASFPG